MPLLPDQDRVHSRQFSSNFLIWFTSCIVNSHWHLNSISFTSSSWLITTYRVDSALSYSILNGSVSTRESWPLRINEDRSHVITAVSTLCRMTNRLSSPEVTGMHRIRHRRPVPVNPSLTTLKNSLQNRQYSTISTTRPTVATVPSCVPTVPSPISTFGIIS